MVSQRENRLDFASIMNRGQILLVKLARGDLGEKNCQLLGTLFVSKLQQTAMGRQGLTPSERKDFWCYVDEFHNFITPSMAEILTGARKYRVGLVLAHQDLTQLRRDTEVGGAIMDANTRVVFCVADADARILATGFASFEANDLKTLPDGQAICRLGRQDFDFNLTVPLRAPEDQDTTSGRGEEVRASSRSRYGTSRTGVERALREIWESQKGGIEPQPSDRPPSKRSQRESPRPKQKEAAEEEAPKQAAKPKPDGEVIAEASEGVGEKTAKEIPGSGTEQSDESTRHEEAKRELQRVAESLDYTVEAEKGICDGRRRIDLVLKRGDVKLACQVCDTTPITREIEVATECLAAGFQRVALVCFSRARLEALKEAISSRPSQEQAPQICCYLKDAFISKLKVWADEDPEGGNAERGKPRKRKIELDNANNPKTEEERRERESQMLANIAARMKRIAGWKKREVGRWPTTRWGSKLQPR
jgi:hypothetical protein